MKSCTIAWIEDEIDILKPLVKPLQQRGIRINEYMTYSQAIDHMDEISRCDLILLDLIIPPGKAKGLEDEENLGKKFLEEFRKTHGDKMPVIILSVFGESEEDGLNQQERNDLHVHCLAKRIRPSKLMEEVLAKLGLPLIEKTGD